jgi:uncharacterized membrane protein
VIVIFVLICSEYEVKSFGGTKSIILTETSSFLGGKNPYLGIATFSAGGVVILLGLLFLLSLCRRKKTWKKRYTKTQVHISTPFLIIITILLILTSTYII